MTIRTKKDLTVSRLLRKTLLWKASKESKMVLLWQQGFRLMFILLAKKLSPLYSGTSVHIPLHIKKLKFLKIINLL